MQSLSISGAPHGPTTCTMTGCALPENLASLATLTVAIALASPGVAQTVTWDGSCGGDDWHACCAIGQQFDNNWDSDPAAQCPPVPGPMDDVDLNGAIVRLAQQRADIRSLFNGDLILAHALGVTEFVNLGALTMISHEINAGGDILVSGPLTWRSGTLAGPPGSRVGVNGPITITDLGNAILDRRALTANGPVSWTGTADIVLNNGASFDNRVSLSLTNNEIVGGSGGTFLNNAPFGKSDSVGETRFLQSAFLDNTDLGSIDIATGTLRIESEGRSRGAWNVSDGATIQFATFGGRTFSILSNTDVGGSGQVWIVGGGPGLTVSPGVRFTAANARLSGVMSGAGACEFGNFTWTSGTLDGAGATTVTGNCLLEGAISRTLNTHTLNLRGSSRWGETANTNIIAATLNNSGALTILDAPKTAVFNNGGRWINETGGTMDIQADLLFRGTGLVQNLDTMNIGPDAALVDFESGLTFEQLGTLNLQTGTLRIRGGRANGAQFNLSADTQMELFSRPFVLEAGTQFTGSGTVIVGGGSTLDVQSGTTVPNVSLTGGSIAGAGTLEVSNQLIWNSGAMVGPGVTASHATQILAGATTLAVSGRTVRNFGQATWGPRGLLHLNNGATYINEEGAVLEVGEYGIDTLSGAGAFRNLGTMDVRISSNGFPFVVNRQTRFEQLGSFNMHAGRATIQSSGLSQGPFQIAADSIVSFVQTGEQVFTFGSGTNFQGPGVVQIIGNVIVSGNVNAVNCEMLAGYIDGGDLNVSNRLLWRGGAMLGGFTRATGVLEISTDGGNKSLDSHILYNLGTGSLAGSRTGQITLNDRSAFFNVSGAEFFVLQVVEFKHANGANASLQNSGTMDLLETVEVGPRVEFHNTGLVISRSGLLLSGGGRSAGEVRCVTPGAVAFLQGSYDWDAGTVFTGDGDTAVINQAVCRVNAEVSASQFNLQGGGTIEGAGTLTIDGLCRWDSGGTARGAGRLINRGDLRIADAALEARTFENEAAAELSANLTMRNGARLVNRGAFLLAAAGGSFEITGTAAELITNQGTFENLGGPNRTIRTPVVNSSGTIHNGAGVLRFSGGLGMFGGSLIADPLSTIIIDGESFVRPAARLEGGGRIQFIPRARNSGRVAPGQSAGKLTVEGELIQEADAVLEVELAGRTPETEHDVLEVIGDVTLAGTLEVKLISNFRPNKGDRFTIITCTTRNGEFDSLILPTSPTAKGANWRVEYHPDHVDLVFDG